MSKLLKCDICGKGKGQLLKLDDGRKICDGCNEAMENSRILEVDTPEVRVWIGQVAKMGDKLYFNIPKEQREMAETGRYVNAAGFIEFYLFQTISFTQPEFSITP